MSTSEIIGIPIAKLFVINRAFEFPREVRIHMDIRFISSLTAEDENLFAPALLKAIGALLDQLPIAYTVRIETTGAEVFHHAHGGAPEGRTTDGLDARHGGAARAVAYLGRANGSHRL